MVTQLIVSCDTVKYNYFVNNRNICEITPLKIRGFFTK